MLISAMELVYKPELLEQAKTHLEQIRQSQAESGLKSLCRKDSGGVLNASRRSVKPQTCIISVLRISQCANSQDDLLHGNRA